MSTILAIETSAELASAALLRDGHVSSREAAGATTHSQNILPMVQSLLAEAGITLRHCDAIGYGLGPGSFTGVRTACGIAQGLAFGAGLPVVPVVSLLAMAEACREQGGGDDVLSVLDARMGEVYWAQYHHDGSWQEVVPPTLSAPAAVAARGVVQACGNGFAAYAEGFAGMPFAGAAHAALMPHAVQVARLAAIAFADGRFLPAAEAQPLYLRNHVALTTSERLARAAAA